MCAADAFDDALDGVDDKLAHIVEAWEPASEAELFLQAVKDLKVHVGRKGRCLAAAVWRLSRTRASVNAIT